MARLVTSGFEWRYAAGADAVTAPDGVSNSALASAIVASPSPVRTGAASLKSDITAIVFSQSWSFAAVTLGNDCFARMYLYVPTGSLPPSRGGVLAIGTSTANLPYSIALEADGTLTLWAFIGGVFVQQGSASASVTLDAWNMIELRARAATGAIDQIEGRLGGVSFASASALTITDSQLAAAVVGWTATVASPASGVFYVDDVAVNDSSGAAQNSWPGSGKVVLLKPISDSAVGTGWTLGTGTAISGGSGSTAVKNTPPVGVADLTAGSDTKQIRNATSNANVNYDANLTSYTTAGIGSSDTINVVVPATATAAPVTTSAKAGTVGVVSNPAIANVALGAGGTAGAFWSGVAAGTYSTGWKWSFGTATYAPSVTVGTSPVMRITQVTASTRIAMVCAMGMYVDYTPAATKAPPFQARTARNSLLRR